MVQYKTEALVLHSRKYKEADGLLTLLTRQRGKVSAVAKGIYKPESKLRGGVQPFSLNEMLLNAGRSNLHSLNQSQCLEMFLPLRSDLDAMAAASCWAELLECFAVEEQEDQGMFQLALSGFYGLATNPKPLMLHALEIRLMKQLGYGPSLNVCAGCGAILKASPQISFAAGAGGLVCSQCRCEGLPVISISPAVVSLWQGLENIGLDKIDRIKVQPEVLNRLSKVSQEWIVYQLGRPLKSWQVLKKMEV